MERIVLGLSESVLINGQEFKAKIDTGARGNSICKTIVDKLSLPYTKKKIWVKSSNGKQLRQVVRAGITLQKKSFYTSFNVTDRSHLKFPILIGVQTLKKGFLVDPSINEIDY